MNNMSSRECLRSFCAVMLLVGVTTMTGRALNVSSHSLVNRRAALASQQFADQLRNAIGIPDGPDAKVRAADGRALPIIQWIEEGGVREDDNPRWLRHFHDPLRPWASAGKSVGPIRAESSVRWMQERDQSGAGAPSRSWRDARQMYYDALVEPDPMRRDALWADLFRALGQVMHLVVDASVPEHTRDDGHVMGALGWGTSYESWITSQQGVSPASEQQFVARYLASPIGVDPAVFDMAPPAGETVAVEPVARLMDSDRYDGSNPSVTLGPAIGLAEVANANFFSEDTVGVEYPQPTFAGLVPVSLPTASGHVRRYLARPAGLGLLPASPLYAECPADAFWQRFAFWRTPHPCTDPLVWDQVARHMLPRAVGYARGVLDYFFRGGLRVAEVAPRAGGLYITIDNTTGEAMDGRFEVYARRHAGAGAETREHVAVLNGGDPLHVDAFGRRRVPLPIGAPAGTPYLVLVFRGQLGAEHDAVVGQVFAVPDVQIVQDTYDADIARGCEPRSESGYTWALEELNCTWTPVNHRIRGRLVTNFAAGQPQPSAAMAIERIEAAWNDADRSPAPLVVGGVTYADGMWIRGEGVTDPPEFEILDPHPRSDRLASITVVLTDPNADDVGVRLVTFAATVSFASKQLDQPSDFRVFGSRSWRIAPPVLPPRFRVTSLGGYPLPTVQGTEHSYLSVDANGAEYTVGDGQFYFGSLADAQAAFDAWEVVNEFPDLLRWEAVVASLPEDSAVRQFHQVFGTTGVVSPVTTRLSGRLSSAP